VEVNTSRNYHNINMVHHPTPPIIVSYVIKRVLGYFYRGCPQNPPLEGLFLVVMLDKGVDDGKGE
jgi:hypothetical protein